MHNDYIYTLYKIEEYESIKDAYGFTCVAPINAKYIMVDRGLTAEHEDCVCDTVLPNWIPLTYPVEVITPVDTGEVNVFGNPIYGQEVAIEQKPLTDNAPHFNEEQALFISRIMASTSECLDGYCYCPVEVNA